MSTIAPYHHDDFGKQFGERHSLLIRALKTGDIQHPPRPWFVTAWADQIDLPFPTELRTAVMEIERRRNLPSAGVSKSNAAIVNTNTPTVDPREHIKLQIIVAGMSTDAYGYRDGAPRQSATAKIVSAVEKLGVTISTGTVLKHLRESMEAAREAGGDNPNLD